MSKKKRSSHYRRPYGRRGALGSLGNPEAPVAKKGDETAVMITLGVVGVLVVGGGLFLMSMMKAPSQDQYTAAYLKSQGR